MDTAMDKSGSKRVQNTVMARRWVRLLSPCWMESGGNLLAGRKAPEITTNQVTKSSVSRVESHSLSRRA